MKRAIYGLVAAFLVSASPLLYCQAAQAESSSTAFDKVMQGSLLPVRVGGVVAGVTVGTPVAVVRESYKSYLDLTGAGAEQIHGRDNGPICLLVSVFTLPTGLVLGACRGSYYGFKNGVTKGFSEPFNGDSFCFGPLDELDK